MRPRLDPVVVFLLLVAVAAVSNMVLTDIGLERPNIATNLTIGTVNNVILIALLILHRQRKDH